MKISITLSKYFILIVSSFQGVLTHTHTQMFTAIQFYSCDNKLAHNTKNIISLSVTF